MATFERCESARDTIGNYTQRHPLKTRGFAGVSIGLSKGSIEEDPDFGVFVIDDSTQDLPPRYARNITRRLAQAGLSDIEVTYDYSGQTASLEDDTPPA